MLKSTQIRNQSCIALNILPAIDHVFHSDQFIQLGKTTRLRKRYDDVWPTDHYPVTVELQESLSKRVLCKSQPE